MLTTLLRLMSLELALDVANSEVHCTIDRLGRLVADQMRTQWPELDTKVHAVPTWRGKLQEGQIDDWIRIVHQAAAERVDLSVDPLFIKRREREIA